MMDLRHMRHFVAVAEELHFGRAALRLHMAQPPLSQSIQRLEEDLGVQLFNRSRLGVELTEAGRVFLGEARRTLLQAELARKITLRAASGTAEVRISFVSAALKSIVPPLIVKFRKSLPTIPLALHEKLSSEQIERLRAGDIDIAFVVSGASLVPTPGELEQFAVHRTRFMAAVPADWPIAQQDSITLKELSEQPFIRPPEKYLHRLPDTLAIFQHVGALPTVALEISQPNVTISLVGAGLGCTLVTDVSIGNRPDNVKFLHISDHPPNRYWELVMLWNQEHLSKSGAAFVKLTKEYVAANPQLLHLPDLPH